MKRILLMTIFLGTMLPFALIHFSSKDLNSFASENIQPPIAKKVPTSIELFGDVHLDDYSWLKARDNADVLSYLLAWNRYTNAKMEPTKPLQNQLYTELKNLVDTQEYSVPYRIGTKTYFEKQKRNQDYPILCRYSKEGKEEILLDQNLSAQDKDYFKVIQTLPSPDGNHLAIAIDVIGTQYGTLFFKDCQTGEWLEENIPLINGEMVWSSDSNGVWYVAVNESFREDRVLYHRLQSSPSTDHLVFKQPNSKYSIELTPSANGDNVFLIDKSLNTSQIYYWKTDRLDATPHLILPKKEGLFYEAEAHENNFYIVAREKSQDILYLASKDQPFHWQPLQLQYYFQAINKVIPFQNFLVIETMLDGLQQFEIWDLVNHKVDYLTFPDPFYAIKVEKHQDFASPQLIFTYESPIQPSITYEYQMGTKELKVLRQSQFENFQPDHYVIERQYAKTTDGAFIPISLFYKKETTQGKVAPMLLMGYGAYGLVNDCGFVPHLLPLINRGFIFGIAHVRGGGEGGPEWHEQGRRQKKMNTFNDFIVCAEYLIQKKYTAPHLLAIEGRSAGGLLMGVMINWRPELFKVVIAEVPFIDAINSLLDRESPLTIQEEEEWGTPYREDDYYYLKAYSPYDNMKKQNHPSVYMTGGLFDAQVAYWEPAKWAAKFLEHQKDKHNFLLKINLSAGHLSEGRMTDKWKEIAFKYAFILSEIGMDKKHEDRRRRE